MVPADNLALNEEGHSDRCYNTGRRPAKCNEPVTKGQTLYDSTSVNFLQVVTFIKAESRMVVARVWGRGLGVGVLLLHGGSKLTRATGSPTH